MLCFCFLFISPHAAAEGGLMFCLCLKKIINDFCQTDYLNIYQTDLRQIFRVGRTLAVNNQSEISFSIPQVLLPRQSIFVGFIHETDSSA